MPRTLYTAKVTFEIEVDPAKPATMTQAAEWMDKLAKGDVITKPDGMKLTTIVDKAPAIANRREKD